MKIKPITDIEKVSDQVRNNPNTKGTHLFIDNGEPNEEKQDYANVVLISLMYERGFLKDTIDETITAASEFTEGYESNNVMGL